MPIVTKSDGSVIHANQSRRLVPAHLIHRDLVLLQPILHSVPALRAAQVAEEATTGTAFDLEMEQRRAYEVVNALLREIEGRTGHPAD
jgi:hypothetical protein